MTPSKKLGCAIALSRLFITTPIWYYLFYQVLVMVGATELMMFLFWVYVPFQVIAGVVEVLFKEALTEAFSNE